MHDAASLISVSGGVVAPGSHHRAVASAPHASSTIEDAFGDGMGSAAAHVAAGSIEGGGSAYGRACDDPEAVDTSHGGSSYRVRVCACRARGAGGAGCAAAPVVAAVLHARALTSHSHDRCYTTAGQGVRLPGSAATGCDAQVPAGATHPDRVPRALGRVLVCPEHVLDPQRDGACRLRVVERTERLGVRAVAPAADTVFAAPCVSTRRSGTSGRTCSALFTLCGSWCTHRLLVRPRGPVCDTCLRTSLTLPMTSHPRYGRHHAQRRLRMAPAASHGRILPCTMASCCQPRAACLAGAWDLATCAAAFVALVRRHSAADSSRRHVRACAPCSTIFHTFNCMSESWNVRLYKLDLLGIMGLILGSYSMGLYYGFYCNQFHAGASLRQAVV